MSLQDARRLVSGFVQHYNTVRLHSAIGYITPPEGQRKRNGVHKSSQAPSLERFGVSRPERATFFTLANDERTSTRVLHYSYGANSMLSRVEKSRWGLTMHASLVSANPHKYYLYGSG